MPTFSNWPDVPSSQKLIVGSLLAADRPIRPAVRAEHDPFASPTDVAVGRGVGKRNDAVAAAVDPLDVPARARRVCGKRRRRAAGRSASSTPNSMPSPRRSTAKWATPAVVRTGTHGRGDVVAERRTATSASGPAVRDAPRPERGRLRGTPADCPRTGRSAAHDARRHRAAESQPRACRGSRSATGGGRRRSTR